MWYYVPASPGGTLHIVHRTRVHSRATMLHEQRGCIDGYVCVHTHMLYYVLCTTLSCDVYYTVYIRDTRESPCKKVQGSQPRRGREREIEIQVELQVVEWGVA